MKAMILAAGLGSRMRPLTETCPKPLLKAGGKPLIDYHLEKLAQAGVREVVVNSAWLSEQILDYLGDGQRYGLSILHSPESEPLETAGGIVKALPLLGDDPFILVNGDIWTDMDFAPLTSISPASAHLFLTVNPAHNPAGDFSISSQGALAERDDDALTFMGVSVWQPAVFAELAQGKRALKPIIDTLIAEQRATASAFHGQWWDIGTPERLAALDDFLQKESA
ncbi:nucleotidyltransferase family protein [Spongiibacter sp. KMU-158]|uniref:Nucleotidyltransferase family protein n=2 Tax=Spongiibacter pelagi TaxID=2760804 RepID=A0A927C0S2_9GAMM|nr:nucleotidyltransferase family protein [Spongiibacter pelagi]